MVGAGCPNSETWVGLTLLDIDVNFQYTGRVTWLFSQDFVCHISELDTEDSSGQITRTKSTQQLFKTTSPILSCWLSPWLQDTRIMWGMGHAVWDDIKILGHCIVSVCQYIARFGRWNFGKSHRPVGWYSSYLLPIQTDGTFQNVIFQTLRQSGKNAL